MNLGNFMPEDFILEHKNDSTDDKDVCKVCLHFGHPLEIAKTHKTKIHSDLDAETRVFAEGWPVLHPISGSTNCPVLMNTKCWNRNCFNHGTIRFPTLGHSRSHCPCAKDQELHLVQNYCPVVPTPQYQVLGSYQGTTYKTVVFDEVIPDQNEDTDRYMIEDYLEDKDDQEIENLLHDLYETVKKNDYVDTCEKLLESSNSITGAEGKKILQKSQTSKLIQNWKNSAQTTEKGWFSSDEEMDFSEPAFDDNFVVSFAKENKKQTQDKIHLLTENIRELKDKLQNLQQNNSRVESWSSIESNEVRNLKHKIKGLSRELDDREIQKKWDIKFDYNPNEYTTSFLYRMGRKMNKIPCLCKDFQLGKECIHEKKHGVGACKFLHIQQRPQIREWVDEKPNTNQNIDPYGSLRKLANDIRVTLKTTKS